MTRTTTAGGRSRNLILTAMIFAVSMTFIAQTIISVAVPQIRRELGLSTTGVQWAVNAYLLALAALFAFGAGHARGRRVRRRFSGVPPDSQERRRRSMANNVPGRAGSRRGDHAPGGAGHRGPDVPLRRRGKAWPLFFGVADGLTAAGPVAGGYLIELTWRAIFWANISVALIALLLVRRSKPETAYQPAPVDYRGLALIATGIGLSLFGFQQSPIWSWSNPAIAACIAAGLVLLVLSAVEGRTASPLIKVSIFRIRPFLVENLMLWVSLLAFVPVPFFASQLSDVTPHAGDPANGDQL